MHQRKCWYTTATWILRTYIQPLLWAGKQLAIRKLKLVQRIGAPQQLTNIVQRIFENVRWTGYTFSLFWFLYFLLWCKPPAFSGSSVFCYMVDNRTMAYHCSDGFVILVDHLEGDYLQLFLPWFTLSISWLFDWRIVLFMNYYFSWAMPALK